MGKKQVCGRNFREEKRRNYAVITIAKELNTVKKLKGAEDQACLRKGECFSGKKT